VHTKGDTFQARLPPGAGPGSQICRAPSPTKELLVPILLSIPAGVLVRGGGHSVYFLFFVYWESFKELGFSLEAITAGFEC